MKHGTRKAELVPFVGRFQEREIEDHRWMGAYSTVHTMSTLWTIERVNFGQFFSTWIMMDQIKIRISLSSCLVSWNGMELETSSFKFSSNPWNLGVSKLKEPGIRSRLETGRSRPGTGPTGTGNFGTGIGPKNFGTGIGSGTHYTV